MLTVSENLEYLNNKFFFFFTQNSSLKQTVCTGTRNGNNTNIISNHSNGHYNHNMYDVQLMNVILLRHCSQAQYVVYVNSLNQCELDTRVIWSISSISRLNSCKLAYAVHISMVFEHVCATTWRAVAVVAKKLTIIRDCGILYLLSRLQTVETTADHRRIGRPQTAKDNKILLLLLDADQRVMPSKRQQHVQPLVADCLWTLWDHLLSCGPRTCRYALAADHFALA